MNIETLVDHIQLFETEVVESGFKRDLQDYVKSLPSIQSNVIALREVASKVQNSLTKIYSGDLPDALNVLLPKEQSEPFTAFDHLNFINELINNTELPLDQLFTKLNQYLNQIVKQINKNIEEINNLNNIFILYIKDNEDIQSKEKAILSIIFKDKKTTTLLKDFSKTVQMWNRTLPLYHQLLSSKSPDDIKIVEVQNGSIDLLINLNIDITLNLVDLFQVGFELYLGYLLYKKRVEEIVKTYFGNKKLIDQESERESEMLNNIEKALVDRIKKQHNNALKKDKKIDTNVDKKIEQVTSLITSHIVKGNDLKLLALPDEESIEKAKSLSEIKSHLHTLSKNVRIALKELPADEYKKLLEKYGSTTSKK